MNDDKLNRLLPHLRCTACGAVGLRRDADSVSCASCVEAYPIVGNAVSFLDDATLRAYRIDDTDNVSDHPFDGNALRLIQAAAVVDGMVLDCGSGYKSEAFDHVIQMEIVSYPHTDVLAVNQHLPFDDATFDVVFSLDVLEHVDDPFVSASEIMRVLKPGGYVYVDIPFLQAEHGYPNHYFNATRHGLLRLFAPLTPIAHIVPASGHPIFTLHQAIKVYSAGLAEGSRDRLLSLTLGELVSRPERDWLTDPICAGLDLDAQWQVASTTQAVLQKLPSVGNMSRVTIATADLPGFRSRDDEPVPPGPTAAPGRTPRATIKPASTMEVSPKEARLIEAKRTLLQSLRRLPTSLERLRRRGTANG